MILIRLKVISFVRSYSVTSYIIEKVTIKANCRIYKCIKYAIINFTYFIKTKI